MTSRVEPSSVRAALTRLPGWVTVLGLVLVLGELTGGAVLLAGGRGGLAALGGATRTVVLQVDSVPVQGIPCTHCFPAVTYTTPTGSGTGGATDEAGRMLPFTRTVRVRAGGTVTLDGNYAGVQSITCSITVNGKVLSQNTSDSTATYPAAHCQSVIP